MRKLLALAGSLAMAVGLLLQSGMAHAQATRTWVSGVGDDANPCSRTAPCKTFAGAISKTAASGVINCLDPGGFGAVTITKSITIDCTGTAAGVLAALTNGINVNAAATDSVTLRGISIEGIGTGLIGVNFIAGGTLHIENCKIYGFNSGTANGIRFAPSAGTARLVVTDTTVNDNGAGSAGGGIVIRASGTAIAKAVIRKAFVSDNSVGIVSEGTTGSGYVHVQIVDTVSSGNASSGIAATGAGSSVFLDRVSSVHNSGAGVFVDGAGAQAVISNSTIADNGRGVNLVNGGNGYSYLTNQINANGGPDGTPLPGTLYRY